MAFDRTNPVNLLDLQNEVLVDPLGIGYSGMDIDTLLLHLNDASLNPNVTVGVPVFTPQALLALLFNTNINVSLQYTIDLLFESTSGLNENISWARGPITAADTQLGNKISALGRNLSRGEVLFSDQDEYLTHEIVVISKDDWIAARDYRA